MLSVLYLIPLSACRRILLSDEKRPGIYILSKKEQQVIAATMAHLLPEEGEGPGAVEIKAQEHFGFVIGDKHLNKKKRRLLVHGIKWTEETAQELYNASFPDIDSRQKEHVLRDLETYTNGERWLSEVLNYTFEALLGAPAYGINTNRTGWKWLDHIPGFPQPTSDKIYGTYGYGL
jgi:gluconate 2-dehydrogenase gamma chain